MTLDTKSLVIAAPATVLALGTIRSAVTGAIGGALGRAAAR